MELYLTPLERDDPDLARVEALHREPSVARFIRISENSFSRFAEAEDAVYYKILSGSRLLGGVQCELYGGTLFLSVCVVEGFRRQGVAFAALKTLIEGLPEGVRRIEASVDGEDFPALRLFEKLGFRRSGWAEGLLTYRLTR